MIVLGGETTRIGCIDVWPEGACDFQGLGGNGRPSTTNNRAEDVARREGARRGLKTIISKLINYYQQKYLYSIIIYIIIH